MSETPTPESDQTPRAELAEARALIDRALMNADLASTEEPSDDDWHLRSADYEALREFAGRLPIVTVKAEESAVYPGSPIIRELQAIRIGMLDHYQAATILERLVGQARSLPIPAPAEARSVDPTAPTVLDVAWININVLGAPDTACRTPEDLAYCRGIGDALAEIEKLGGQPS